MSGPLDPALIREFLKEHPQYIPEVSQEDFGFRGCCSEPGQGPNFALEKSRLISATDIAAWVGTSANGRPSSPGSLNHCGSYFHPQCGHINSLAICHPSFRKSAAGSSAGSGSGRHRCNSSPNSAPQSGQTT